VCYVYKSVDDVLEQGKMTGSSRKEYRWEWLNIVNI
jgi:hypothetical protein